MGVTLIRDSIIVGPYSPLGHRTPAPPMTDDSALYRRSWTTMHVADGVTLPTVGTILRIGCGHVRVEGAADGMVTMVVFPDAEVWAPAAQWQLVDEGARVVLAPVAA